MYAHILIATDGSEFAAKGLDHGLALAKRLGAEATVVTVTAPWISLGYEGTAGWSGGAAPIVEYETAMAQTAQSILDAAGKAALEAGIPCSLVHVPDKHPADGIVETAEKKGADLIVMASHGRRGLKRLLLGSQATQVLSLSQIPVLVVR